MVDYETFCKIHEHLEGQRLSAVQTARALGLSTRTVRKWGLIERFRARAGIKRASKLDPFKGQIVRWLDAHPYSAQQILQRLREAGYGGGLSIVKDYVARVRPRKRAAFLTLHFAAAEAAQLDWGEFGTLAVDGGARRLSFLVMVLCYSRRLHVEFTLSQSMEFFLAAQERAFIALGGVPRRVVVDNLKSAVLQRLMGSAPVFNPNYAQFARHWGFEISACNVRAAHEKGRVENGVGYVKKNLLAGLQISSLAALQAAAELWVRTVADVRVHAATHERPLDRFERERTELRPPSPTSFDFAQVRTVRASKQCRVAFDSNTYSVPARCAGQRLTLRGYADRVCVHDGEQLLARHARCMGRHQDVEDPEHARALLAQRHTAREQRLLVQFLALSPRAGAYLQGLQDKRIHARAHLRKILALAELHGREAVVRAIDDGLAMQAFSAEYIEHILGARRRINEPSAPLQLTRAVDLLDLELPEPDLSIYEPKSKY